MHFQAKEDCHDHRRSGILDSDIRHGGGCFVLQQ